MSASSELSCSFASFTINTSCGLSPKNPGHTRILPLSACTGNVRAHLRQLSVAQSCVASEKELILARAGLFDEDGTTLTICPKHRDELGKHWKRLNKCKHPLHGNSKRKPERGANLKLSKEIKQKWGVLVPLGAGICRACRNDQQAAFNQPAPQEEINTPALLPDKAPCSAPDIDETRNNSSTESLQSGLDAAEAPQPPQADSDDYALDLPMPFVHRVQFADRPHSESSQSSTTDTLFSGQSSGPETEKSLEWQPTPQMREQLYFLNTFLRRVEGNVSPVRSQLGSDVSEISSRTSRYYKRKAVQAVETVLDVIAPGNSKWLFQQVVDGNCSVAAENLPEKELLATLIRLYEEASSWNIRRQILSIFVRDYSKSDLQAMIPGLSKWSIDEARRHAFENSPGRAIDAPKLQRSLLDPTKVDHFLDFIASPSFLQDVAYGTKKLKLTTGEEIEIPNVVRTVIASRLVQLYQLYCAELDFTPLGRSTLFNILKVCAASQKKSLAGLDATQTDGVLAFSSLEAAVTQLYKLGLNEQRAQQLKHQLKSSRQYLKTDYRIHLSSCEPCTDHCSVHALSTSEPEFNGACDHLHDIACDRCEEGKNVLLDIQVAMSSDDIAYSSDDQREETQHDIETAIPKIEEWKAHIVRAAHQDAAKSDIINELSNQQVLIVMDWAMKFLPASFRETQRDWFGKKGKSWHVSVVIMKRNEAEENETRSFVHAVDNCTQNWFAVLSIIEHTLREVKALRPNVTEAFLRSDNAGCYHCAYLILSLPCLGNRVGINVRRYDFSEPQAGKDICDRRIASLKSHMRRFVNEGNDIHGASDMKRAIESHGGVKGCYVAVVKIVTASQTMVKHSMTGIQAINNFLFQPDGSLRVWKAYRVGPGKVFTKSQLLRYGNPQGPTNVQTIHPFSTPTVETGVFSARTSVVQAPPPASEPGTSTAPPPSTDQAEASAFCCPEEGCIKRYQSFSALQRHLDVGKHMREPERESAFDNIRRKWAETCRQVSGGYVQAGASSSTTETHPVTGACVSSECGWGLKRSKRAVRFPVAVRSHLKEIFMRGEETGHKANAADVATKMRSARGPDGNKLFRQSEWLTPDQVARYFSRLSSLYHSGRISLEAATATTREEEQEEDFVTEAEEITRRREIRRQIEL